MAQDAVAPWEGAPRKGRQKFRREMTRTISASHPAIQPVVDAIRRISNDPLEQLVLVEESTLLLVQYHSDQDVYGRRDYHATLDEMLLRRDRAGWERLRDDCDGRAVFAAHLLEALGFNWRLETSYWKRHAWVSVVHDGARYDLLDLRAGAPELRDRSYRLVGRWLTRPTRRLPAFGWHGAWVARTGADLEVGHALGVVSERALLAERESSDPKPDGRALAAKSTDRLAAGLTFHPAAP